MSKDTETKVEIDKTEGEVSPETTAPADDENQSEKENPSDESEIETQIDEDVDTGVIAPFEEEFAKLKTEYEEKYDQMLRKIAEYDNAKKRAERRAEESSKYAVEGVIKDVIPVIDSVERAIESTKESKDFDGLSEGVKLIHKQLLDSLQRRNVNAIEAIGVNFDPTRHEAILHVESEEVSENVVIEEYQRGYVLHDRVIRPSMVSVSKGKPEKMEQSDSVEEETEVPDRVSEKVTNI